MMQQIDQIKVCAPRPERCEGLVMATVPGQHEYEWYCNGRTITLGRDIQSVNLYQEGEGSFAYAVAKGAIVVEPGDGISVHESFNLYISTLFTLHPTPITTISIGQFSCTLA